MARKAVLIGLIVILALAAVAVAACGGGGNDATAKAAVQASLAKIDATIADLTSKGTSGALTVPDIKAARDQLKPEVQSVVDNGKKIKGADTAKIEKAWADLDKAVTDLPDSATLAQAAGVLMTKVTPLTSALNELKALVTPTS